MKVAAEKAALRRRARRRRDALVNGELKRRSAAIARRVMELSGWQRARSRLLFRSFGSEVRS